MVTQLARGVVAAALRRVLGDRDSRAEAIALGSDPDPGLFGPDSVTWRLHADPAMLIGGLRALFVQTLQPLTMAGVAEHSDYRVDPLGRLARTSEFVVTTTYGSTAQADGAVARVRQIHERVKGTAPDGRPYSANDPHLLSWVHNVEVDSFLRAVQRYGSITLSDADADRYVAEMTVLGARMGADELPRSVDELRRWLREVPEQRATPAARATVRFLVFPNIPLAMRPAYAIVSAAAIGLVPRNQRWMLWLPVVPLVDPLLVRPAARALLAVLGWAIGPPPILDAARARVGVA